MIKKIILFLIILTSLHASPAFSADSDGYVTLEPGLWRCLDSKNANCVSNSNEPVIIKTTNLGEFLNQVFNFGIAIAVALSIIVISIGGIQYMTTDSWSKKEEGKERIKNAISGLVLALISWLILFTINPCLVTFNGTGPNGTKCFNKLISETQPDNYQNGVFNPGGGMSGGGGASRSW